MYPNPDQLAYLIYVVKRPKPDLKKKIPISISKIMILRNTTLTSEAVVF